MIQQHWEKAWQEHKRHLEQHLQLCQFNQDLRQVIFILKISKTTILIFLEFLKMKLNISIHFSIYIHNQINNQLNELSIQLSSIRGNYGESLPAAKATSQAFVRFEKTIEVSGII